MDEHTFRLRKAGEDHDFALPLTNAPGPLSACTIGGEVEMDYEATEAELVSAEWRAGCRYRSRWAPGLRDGSVPKTL